MSDTDLPPEPAHLRNLRRLVSLLMIVMILGLLTIVGLFVMRFAVPSNAPLLTDIRLPQGVKATAYTRGADWYAIVTTDDRILIYNLDQSLRQEIAIAAGN